STFVRKLCASGSVHIDKQGTTVALDHGMKTHFGIPVSLFGTPGLERFEVLRKILSRGADGAIMILDSANPGSFEESRNLFAQVFKYLPEGTPILICANKQDVKGAVKPENILELIEVKESDVISVVGISALNGENLDRALGIMVLAVLNRYRHRLSTVHEYGLKGLPEISKKWGVKEDETRQFLQWLSWRQLILADWEEELFMLPRPVREVLEILDYAKTLTQS
ncbi:MAG: ADP-ribosylation factor-like protein, partial [Candidatus Hodarchaeota archaeon]